MPRPRQFTDAQEAEALAWFRANPKRGALKALSRRLNIAHPSTRLLLKRAAERETQREVSHETSQTVTP